MAHLSTARGVFFPMPVARPLWCPVPPAVPFGQLLARDWRRQAGQRNDRRQRLWNEVSKTNSDDNAGFTVIKWDFMGMLFTKMANGDLMVIEHNVGLAVVSWFINLRNSIVFCVP